MVAPVFSETWKHELNKMTKYFAEKIKDLSLPIDSFVDELLKWMEKPICSYEPYAFLIKRVLGIHYHNREGKDVNVNDWTTVFPRLEEIMVVVNERGSDFCKVIMNETIAHRYLDYWIATKDPVYEEKMKKAYLLAYDASVKGNYPKNIDSTIFWLAKAYERVGDMEKAREYYCQVAMRTGRRFQQALHFKKIREAKEKCKAMYKRM